MAAFSSLEPHPMIPSGRRGRHSTFNRIRDYAVDWYNRGDVDKAQ
jgi:hypothetical protein